MENLKQQNEDLQSQLKKKHVCSANWFNPLPWICGRKQPSWQNHDDSESNIPELTKARQQGLPILPSLKVQNPITGKLVNVTNFSYHDCTVMNIAKKAEKENDLNGPYSKALKNMMQQALQQGLSLDDIATDYYS